MEVVLVLSLSISVMSLYLNFCFAPRCTFKRFLICENIPSSVLVVFGSWRLGSFWYVKRKGRFVIRDRYADRSLRCVYVQRFGFPEGQGVRSEKNSAHLSCQSRRRPENVSFVVSVSRSDIARSADPASVLGLRVRYLVTIFTWWNWHICTGIPSNTLAIPRFPSRTTPSTSHPCFRSSRSPSSYAAGVSSVTSLHQRFFLSVGERNTTTP